MKNSMQDLNNILFCQLERLNDESTPPEKMKLEVDKANAVAKVASVISKNAALELKAQQLADDGHITGKPKILESKKQIGSTQ